MAHGKNAEKNGHLGKEYWSPRLRGMWPWGKDAKEMTHRRERAAERRVQHKALVTEGR